MVNLKKTGFTTGEIIVCLIVLVAVAVVCSSDIGSTSAKLPKTGFVVVDKRFFYYRESYKTSSLKPIFIVYYPKLDKYVERIVSVDEYMKTQVASQPMQAEHQPSNKKGNN